LLGAAGALALAAAFAAAERALDATLGPAELARAFLAPELNEPGRLQLVELADGTAVLDDTYNANPASVESSLLAARELARVRQARLVLVIGEMRELGSYSPALHGEVGEQIAGSGASALIAVAGDALHFVAPARARGMQASFAEDSEHALEQALRTVRAGDVVLVKASRGVRTERVVQGLLAARGRAA
jgi:UDP-N-acetylmuramoyl-tripeptide--D-alanyl-D-alanine ligase